MALSDLAVFSEYLYSATTEVLQEQVDLFNTATNGAMILSTAAHQGDYSDTAFWGRTSGLIRRRNPYGDGNIEKKSLEHLVDTMVKIASGTPEMEFNPSQYAWIQRAPEEAAAAFGQQLAVETMADMRDVAISGTLAALNNDIDEVGYDGTTQATATMNPRMLNRGTQRFGDMGSKIGVWVMHSTPLYDMFDNNLANGSELFTYGTVRIVSDIAGRPFVVSDSPALFEAGANADDPANFKTLGLTQNAVIIDQNGDFIDNWDSRNGQENIQRTYQAEWSYNLGIKGYAWNKNGGGKAPNNAALATSANWQRYATSHKDLAGVIVSSN